MIGKKIFYKIPIETAKPFALRISKLCRDRPDYFKVTRSPLHIAVTKGHSPFFEYIYEKVMEKNPRDYLGRVPLHLAVNNKNLGICKFIYEKGHPLDPRSHHRNTPLHDAASEGNLCVFKFV